MEGHCVRGAPGLRSGEDLWVAGRIAVKATPRFQETASTKERNSPLSSQALEPTVLSLTYRLERSRLSFFVKLLLKFLQKRYSSWRGELLAGLLKYSHSALVTEFDQCAA
jgi:hypothetical protein